MTVTIRLPFPVPPLRSNDRMHHQAKAKITREIRQAAAMVAKRKRVKPPVAVVGVWSVTDRRRRDAGSIAPTIKAALDGFTDAGVWPDDNGRYVLSETYRIEQAAKPGVRVEILPIDPDDLCMCSVCEQLFPTVKAFDEHRRTER